MLFTMVLKDPKDMIYGTGNAYNDDEGPSRLLKIIFERILVGSSSYQNFSPSILKKMKEPSMLTTRVLKGSEYFTGRIGSNKKFRWRNLQCKQQGKIKIS